MERWQMNRFGFVNFWVYDIEEFQLENGKILLRGSNGSGKSITTQSLIPYILDGDRQPTRLDPFGSKDRKMSFYIIGDSENGKEESTGYIWMEFVKPDSRQYRTIGIGLHAKKGGKMNTWGFCITDGRRIGHEFFLYKEVGSQIIPHDVKNLKKELGENNTFVEKPTDYKIMVADKIFGIGRDRIEDFDQLTNILIKTRSSKLASKENLKPAQLYAILNESLRTLSDEDLHPITDAMSKIEDSHNKIEEAGNALKDAEAISDEYEKYNKYMLWKKADIYLNKNKEVKKSENEYKSKQNQIKDAKEKIRLNTENFEKAQTQLEDLQAERNSLDISDIKEYISKKEDNEGRLEQLKEDGEIKQKSIEDKTESINKKYKEQNEVSDRIGELEYSIKNKISEISEYEEESYPFYDYFLRSLKSGEPMTSDRYSKDYNSFREKLNIALENIKECENKKFESEKAEERLVFLKDKYESAKLSFEEAQSQLNSQKDEIIERLYFAAKNNAEYHIDEFMIKKAEKIISNYEGQGSANEFLKLLSANNNDISSKLNSLLAESKHELEIKKEVCKNLEFELETLKNTNEPVPYRSEERKEARRALDKNGIKYRSFYECIDFKPNFSDMEKAVIESEISDMGILDSIVLCEKQRENAFRILSDYSDSYILGSEDTQLCESKFFNIVADDDFSEELKKILSSIERKVKIGLDGYYSNGIVGGHAVGGDCGGFIGAESRKKYREKQIVELELKLSESRKAYEESLALYDNILERLKVLKSEYEKISDISDLNTSLDLVFGEQRNFDNAEKNKNEQANNCKRIKTELDLKYKAVNESCLDFPDYQKTSANFKEVLKNLEKYIDLIRETIGIINNRNNKNILLGNINESIQESEGDIDILHRDLINVKRSIHSCEENIRICSEFLNRPENIDRSKRIDEIYYLIKELNRQKDIYSQQITEFKTRLQIYNNDLEKIESERKILIEEENVLAGYFKEELELRYIISEDNISIKENAILALSLITPGDEKKSVNEISSRMNEVYRKHTNTLSAEYRPMYNILFEDSGSDVIRSRMCITLAWKGKQISPISFKKELIASISHDKELLKHNEEEMFKNILLNTISKKLSNRIRESNEWVKSMSSLMTNIKTSMGLTFSLSWTPRKDLGENELKFDELNKLLAKDQKWINADDITKLTNHFRSRIEYEKKVAEEKGEDINYSDIIKKVLDFRNWFEFRLQYKDPKMTSFRDLVDSRFNTFSGGERALSLYIPLFAAVAAQYEKAGEQAPRILALDEAFAGVDDSNISEMFALLEKLNFGYIVNSQALWGCYNTVPSLSIAELFHEKDSDLITVIKYKWNGRQKQLSE